MACGLDGSVIRTLSTLHAEPWRGRRPDDSPLAPKLGTSSPRLGVAIEHLTSCASQWRREQLARTVGELLNGDFK